jgi:hypothetical protein
MSINQSSLILTLYHRAEVHKRIDRGQFVETDTGCATLNVVKSGKSRESSLIPRLARTTEQSSDLID